MKIINKGSQRSASKGISGFVIFSVCFVFVTLAVYLYSPVFKSNAAEESVDVTVNVESTVSLSLDKNSLRFDITPTVAGFFDSDSIVATVDTNSVAGYELYFSSEDNNTALTSLVTESAIVSDFNSTVTSATMANNRWGYSLDNTNFNKIPTRGNPAKIRDIKHTPSVSERDTTLGVATKIDVTLPSGVYTKTVIFSAIAHPAADPHINRLIELTSMQDPNLAQYCAETYTPTIEAKDVDWERLFFSDLVPRAVVPDERDNKRYLISKLADGNCWMSQNLALDLTANVPVVSSNNDGTTGTFTPTNSTQTTAGTIWGRNPSNIARSYRPPAEESYYQNGITMTNAPTENTDDYLWEKAGNLYNWYAATAGTGLATYNDEETTASICPKGWMLPKYTGDKSYMNLLLATYGDIKSFDTANMYNVNYSTVLTVEELRENPLNFTIQGWYNRETGALMSRGTTSVFWAAKAGGDSARNGAGFLINYTNSAYQSGSYKGNGNPVRCVAI